MKCKNIIILTVAALMLSSCNASRFGWSSNEGARTSDGTPKMVEDFDPLTLNDDDIVVEKQLQPAEAAADEQSEGTRQPSEVSDETVPKMVPGFRVNLMSGKDEAAINEEKKKAMFKFRYDVYVVFESPYYKIRLGDFLTEEEAAEVRDLARNRGFDGAFLARSLVDRAKAEQNRQF